MLVSKKYRPPSRSVELLIEEYALSVQTSVKDGGFPEELDAIQKQTADKLIDTLNGRLAANRRVAEKKLIQKITKYSPSLGF